MATEIKSLNRLQGLETSVKVLLERLAYTVVAR